MAWKLATLTARIKLVHELRARGFYVRWHAYEFILYREGPVGVLLLEPSKGRAELICRSGVSVEEVSSAVSEALRTVTPTFELRVRVSGEGAGGGAA